MSRQWEPGDVAMVTGPAPYVDQGGDFTKTSTEVVCSFTNEGNWRPLGRRDFGFLAHEARTVRPLIVIDPGPTGGNADELARQLRIAANSCRHRARTEAESVCNWLAGEVERQAGDPKPEEPTDPKAHVTDRRHNIWRLLADGEWICTSGPDTGEYLIWDQLAEERGPISVEVTS